MTSHPVSAADAGTWMLGDLKVNRMGFGGHAADRHQRLSPWHAPRPRPGDPRAPPRSRTRRQHIDTAAFYFSRLRSANELINSALAPYSDDLLIATKVGPARDADGKWVTSARPDELRGQVEENLRQLGRDHLDLVNLRLMGQDDISEHFGALAELRDAGLVRRLGISGARPEHLAQARAVSPVVCVQNRYGIGAAGGEEMLRACAAHGIAFVPFFSLAGKGGEAGAVRAEPDEVGAVARAHGVSPAQVRLAWILQQGEYVPAIPGTGNPEHLAANVAAGALQLARDELQLLDSIDRSAS